MTSPAQSPRYWFAKPFADFVQRLRVAAGFLLLVMFALLARPSAASLFAGLPICLAGLAIRALGIRPPCQESGISHQRTLLVRSKSVICWHAVDGTWSGDCVPKSCSCCDRGGGLSVRLFTRH